MSILMKLGIFLIAIGIVKMIIGTIEHLVKRRESNARGK